MKGAILPTSTVASRLFNSRIAIASLAGVVQQCLFAGLSLIHVAILARVLEPSGFGIYTIAASIVALLAVPCSFGLSSLVTRETAKARQENRWDQIEGVYNWAVKTVFYFSIVLGLVVCLAAFGLYSQKPILSVSLVFAANLLLLTPLVKLNGARLIGLGHTAIGQFPEKVVRPACVVCLIGIAYLCIPNALTSPVAIFLDLLSYLLALFAGAYFLRRYHGEKSQIKKTIEVSLLQRQWFRDVVPFALTSGMFVINRYTDVLMLGYLTDSADVGTYGVATQISLLIAFGLNAVNTASGPKIVSLYQTGRILQLQNLVSKASKAAFSFAVTAAILYVFLGRPLITLFFSVSYIGAYFPAMVLIAGQVVNAFSGSGALVLNMTNRQRLVTIGVSISSIANLLLNAILIPRFGMMGAALATSSSMILWNVILVAQVQRQLGFNCLAFSYQKSEAPQ